MRNAIYCVSHKELNSFISNTITQNLETKTDRKLKLVLSSRVTAKNERTVDTLSSKSLSPLSSVCLKLLNLQAVWAWLGIALLLLNWGHFCNGPCLKVCQFIAISN